MAAKAVLFVLIFSLLGLSMNGAEYEFFQMVQQWGPAKCSDPEVRCYAQPQSMFTIYGLWPSNFTNLFLHFCSTTQPFDVSKVSTLLTELTKYWPDLVKGDNRTFWKKQWEKHGTCSISTFDISNFFQHAINIRTNAKYDLLAILNAAGTSQDIESVIKTATGKNPWVKCNDRYLPKIRQLFEIVLCLKQDGVTLMDCPGLTNHCSGSFLWLPGHEITADQRRSYII